MMKLMIKCLIILIFLDKTQLVYGFEKMSGWNCLWSLADGQSRAKLFTQFLYQIHQPDNTPRAEIFIRYRKLQDIIAASERDPKDNEIKSMIEQVLSIETTAYEAGLDENITLPNEKIISNHLTSENIGLSCSHQACKVNLLFSWYPYFDPEKINVGDSIFVLPTHLDFFFKVYHPLIKNSYVLVTTNSDLAMPGKFASMLDDDKLIAWFCCNMDDTEHAKLHPLPLGIRPQHLDVSRAFDSALIDCAPIYKKNLLYLNFHPESFPSRRRVFKLFANKQWVTVSNRKPLQGYLQDLMESKFILSPRGGGLDCWRTWEALCVGSFPIVLTSSLDCLFDDLPVVIVDKWEKVTEEFLRKKYIELSERTYNKDKLSTEYWMTQIRSYGS